MVHVFPESLLFSMAQNSTLKNGENLFLHIYTQRTSLQSTTVAYTSVYLMSCLKKLRTPSGYQNLQGIAKGVLSKTCFTMNSMSASHQADLHARLTPSLVELSPSRSHETARNCQAAPQTIALLPHPHPSNPSFEKERKRFNHSAII